MSSNLSSSAFHLTYNDSILIIHHIYANSGHLAVAEYGDPEEDHQHNRTSSKFQWQNVLSGVGDGDDTMNVGSSRQLSRCYSARTRVVRRNLNPVFNEEFRFEVADDTLLQVRYNSNSHGRFP